MSIWRPRPREVRSTSPFAAMPMSQAVSAMLSATSYADVHVSTPEQALQSVAVRAAVDLLASLASELPVHVYSGQGSSRRERPMPGYLEDPAGDGNGLADWSYQVAVSWLLRGNMYGTILSTGPGGIPTQIDLHHPDDVGAMLQDGVVTWSLTGKVVTDAQTWLHRRVNPMPGRVLGLSPIALHAEQMGLSLTATRFGRQWFSDGAQPGGLLINKERDLKPDQAKTAKDRFMASLRGRREPAVLDRGWEYQQIQISPEESQFLQTQGFSEAQCCRIFGPGLAEILGYESGGSLTYGNVVDRDLHVLKYALNKWLRRLERLLTDMLPRPQYVRIDRDALLQTNTLARYQAYQSALQNRWRTVNEVRGDEDLPPVPWGDAPNDDDTSPAGEDQPTTGEAPREDGT